MDCNSLLCLTAKRVLENIGGKLPGCPPRLRDFKEVKPHCLNVRSHAVDYISGSQPGCRGTLGRHLQYPGVPRVNTFFIISLKRYFQNVAKNQSKLLWVRH